MQDKNRGIWIEDWIAEITEHERLFALLYTLCLQNGKPDIELGVSYICERLHKSERTIRYWIADMVEEGCITVEVKRGRGARNTFRLNMQLIAGFIDEKTCKVLTENRQANMQQVAGFGGLPLNPSNDKKRENNKKNNKNNSSFDASTKAEDEKEIERGEKIILFREDEEVAEIDAETKKQFAMFWRMFKPDEEMKSRYKKALIEWSRMTDIWREACLTLLRGGRHPQDEKNPYYFLQHFGPENYFLNGRQQYDMWKKGMQLCRVRYNGNQPIVTPFIAELFKLDILDDHFEKGFEN